MIREQHADLLSSCLSVEEAPLNVYKRSTPPPPARTQENFLRGERPPPSVIDEAPELRQYQQTEGSEIRTPLRK